MANFYTDIPELKYHLNNPMMERICQLKERDYRDKDEFDYAPQDYADAMDSYDKILEITGEITGETIAPNAEGVDEEGPHCGNGRVEYASGTKQNLDAMVKAGLNGMTMPRRFGGLNFPITPYTMCAEIVAAADAGFGNIWSLQDCIETLYEFGNEDQHSRFIPRICAGETMSMDLTEPDAGSDLQSVMLKATFDEANNCWRLNGVKRFITNGDANLHLVLARSEEGTKDGRGLSMFIYDKNEGGVDVRRIENKLGIHGSPTCELVYKNAKAELCGDRKLGLIKYVMALMNGARLGIAAQSVGLSQAAYNEGLAYAKERKQFGKAIIDFPAVYDMLSIMKAKLDAGRALLYQTSRYVDIYKALDDIARERKLTPEERQEQKVYAKLADSFTPLSKGMNSEYANQNAYDCIQIHGGSGFMMEYASFLYKLMALLRAGLTIRGAFERLAQSRQVREHYIDEEIRRCCNEMKSGVPEAQAYENFGRRCQLPEYIKMGTILAQNLRKGSDGLADLLEAEALRGMEERHQLARKLGEQAGTKLLFPMMLMFGVVLIILMAPALMSFSF